MNNLILCGFKNCGKTTWGRCIAKKIGWNFVDTDLLVSSDCSACYREKGEKVFREKESQVICSLSSIRKSVIATGAGSVLLEQNVTLLKNLGKIFYLFVEKEELKRRFLSQSLPAFLQDQDFEEAFQKMYTSRVGIYSQIADYTIYTEEQLWQVIHSDPFFELPPGESLTALR